MTLNQPLNAQRAIVVVASSLILYITAIGLITFTSGPPINTPDAPMIALTTAERDEMEANISRWEMEIQRLEARTRKLVETQRWLYTNLSEIMIEVDSTHRLNQSIYDRLGPASALQLPDVTKTAEVHSYLEQLEHNIHQAMANGNLNQVDGFLALNRVASLRWQLNEVERFKQKVLLKWELYQEQKAIDDEQLERSFYELEQKVLARQSQYDERYPPVLEPEPYNGEENWQPPQYQEVRPPRPRLPSRPANPYNRPMSITDVQASHLYQFHKADGDTIQTQHVLAGTALAIATRQSNIIYTKQLLHLNARPNVH